MVSLDLGKVVHRMLDMITKTEKKLKKNKEFFIVSIHCINK